MGDGATGERVFLDDLARLVQDPTPVSRWRVQWWWRSNGSSWNRTQGEMLRGEHLEPPTDLWVALFDVAATPGDRAVLTLPVRRESPIDALTPGGPVEVAGVVAVGRAQIIDPGGLRVLPVGAGRRLLFRVPRFGGSRSRRNHR